MEITISGEDPKQADVCPMGDGYWELWNPELQANIDKNIDKYRKANAVLKIESFAPGSEAKVEQVSHDFLFGANIFNFNQLGTKESNVKYKALFGELFNSATIPFYWSKFEYEQGNPRYVDPVQDEEKYWNGIENPSEELYWRRPAPDQIVEFCESKGLQTHGHPIYYGKTSPTWIVEKQTPETIDELEFLINKHIVEIAEYYQGRIQSWDIVNESVEPIPGEYRWGLMPEDFTFKSYKLSEEKFPDYVLLNINDSWRSVYAPFVKDLIERGAKIDVVGLQMHMFDMQPCLDIAEGKAACPNGISWEPTDVINYLKDLDALDRPIHLSEISIPSPGLDQKAEAIQAVLTKNMYRLWFSWPSIHRITWWNLIDNGGYAGELVTTGLFTMNMEPKESYYTLNDLINREWKTNAMVKVDDKGIAKFRGFKGKYSVTWTDVSGNEHQAEFYLKNDGDGFYE